MYFVANDDAFYVCTERTTVKPDVYLRRFTERAIGHPVSDAELIRAAIAAGHRDISAVRALGAARLASLNPWVQGSIPWRPTSGNTGK